MPVSSAPGSARDLTWTGVLPDNGTFPVDLTGSPTFGLLLPAELKSRIVREQSGTDERFDGESTQRLGSDCDVVGCPGPGARSCGQVRHRPRGRRGHCGPRLSNADGCAGAARRVLRNEVVAASSNAGAEGHRAADWCRSGGIRRRLFPHLGSGTFITLRVLAAVALLILAP